jgi:regulatory protein
MVVTKGKITAIKAGKNPALRRSNVFLNGRYAFSLDDSLITSECLQIGRVLSEEEVNRLLNADRARRCYDAALRLISLRPRSEKEIRDRLIHRFDPAEVESTITRLKENNLINDAEFARFWIENRETFKPRSRRLLKQELRSKGVDSALIAEITGGLDESEAAYQAGLAKARSLPHSDYLIFRQKLGGYLQRRGFGYNLINSVVRRIWQETAGDSGRELTTTVEDEQPE